MSSPEPEGSDSDRGVFAPLGIFLIVSGFIVILVAAFANPVVAAAGPFMIASGIGLVVASEYRDEAEMKYDRWLGLRLWTRKDPDPAEGDREPSRPRPTGEDRKRPALKVIHGQGKSGCPLTQALSRRRR